MVYVIQDFLSGIISLLSVDFVVYPTVSLLVMSVLLVTIQIIKGRG